MRPSDRKKDRVLIGILTGTALPIVGYAILLIVYEQLTTAGFASDINLSIRFRERTVALIAICFNLLLVRYFNKRYMTNSMRGVVFPTMVYVVIWLFYFRVFEF